MFTPSVSAPLSILTLVSRALNLFTLPGDKLSLIQLYMIDFIIIQLNQMRLLNDHGFMGTMDRTVQIIKSDVGGATFGREIDKMYIRVTSQGVETNKEYAADANVIGSS